MVAEPPLVAEAVSAGMVVVTVLCTRTSGLVNVWQIHLRCQTHRTRTVAQKTPPLIAKMSST